MFLRLSVLLFIVLCSNSLLAQVSQNFLKEELPQYELGAGAIGLNIPTYPGSKNSQFRVVPFPYYIYRGKYLRSDDEGTRARLLSSKYHELGFSFGFNFPVNSNDSEIRRGMPDLDGLVLFGPRIMFRFFPDSKNHRLNFTLAGRAVFSSKFSFNNLFRAEGFSWEPRLQYWYRWQKTNTTFFSGFGFEFGSAKYNQFFYNVDPNFATPNRPAYLAKAGVVESSLSLGLGQSLSDTWFIFGGVSWRNLDLAANRDSPIVETRDNIGVLLGLVWTFFESEEKVKIIED